jgi:hypothetical protein
MDNGQVDIGRLRDAGKAYAVMTDVFYVHTVANAETRQTQSMLIRRGKEWHAPTSMHINSRHILMIEPVAGDSRVAQLIEEAKKQRSEQK